MIMLYSVFSVRCWYSTDSPAVSCGRSRQRSVTGAQRSPPTATATFRTHVSLSALTASSVSSSQSHGQTTLITGLYSDREKHHTHAHTHTRLGGTIRTVCHLPPRSLPVHPNRFGSVLRPAAPRPFAHDVPGPWSLTASEEHYGVSQKGQKARTLGSFSISPESVAPKSACTKVGGWQEAGR